MGNCCSTIPPPLVLRPFINLSSLGCDTTIPKCEFCSRANRLSGHCPSAIFQPGILSTSTSIQNHLVLETQDNEQGKIRGWFCMEQPTPQERAQREIPVSPFCRQQTINSVARSRISRKTSIRASFAWTSKPRSSATIGHQTRAQVSFECRSTPKVCHH